MFGQMSFLDSLSATSSPEVVSGAMPFAAPAGPTIARSGPVPAHASLSAKQAKERGLLTSGTFGPLGSGSSTSASLSACLASRLQTRVQMLGSTLYKLTWKEWVTPSGVSRLRLRASVRRTLATGLSGWPTPRASDTNGAGLHGDGGMDLRTSVLLSGWPTPDATLMNDGANVENHFARLARMKAKHNNGNGAGLTIAIAAQLTGWATPCAMEPDQSPETVLARKARLSESTGIFRGPALPLGSQVQLAGWPTPVVSDSAKAENAALRPRAMVLGNAAMLSGWPTPCAQDGPNGGPAQGTDRLPGAAAQVTALRGRLTDSGQMLIGSTAEIPEVHDGGPLTAAHSLWLQALPVAWERCAYRAMQSMPKSRRASSKR